MIRYLNKKSSREIASANAILLTASRAARAACLFNGPARALFAVLIVLLAACPAKAAETMVTGTSNPGQDLPNVQAAVDKGGLVMLRGRFDFGLDGRVKITKNVRIRGEADSVDEAVTTITGGFWTFYAPLPVKGAPPADKGPIISIRQIRFDGAKGTPMHFPHVGGLDVRGCTVTNVIPQQVDIEWSGGDTLHFQAGIVVGNRIDHPKSALKRAVTGHHPHRGQPVPHGEQPTGIHCRVRGAGGLDLGRGDDHRPATPSTDRRATASRPWTTCSPTRARGA